METAARRRHARRRAQHRHVPGGQRGQGVECSAALIGPDLILTAGHCSGARAHRLGLLHPRFPDRRRRQPAGRLQPEVPQAQAAREIRVRQRRDGRRLRRPAASTTRSSRSRRRPAGSAYRRLPIRADLPAVGEEVFLIHHPRGAAKKVLATRRPIRGCYVQIVAEQQDLLRRRPGQRQLRLAVVRPLGPHRRRERLGRRLSRTCVRRRTFSGISAQAAAAILLTWRRPAAGDRRRRGAGVRPVRQHEPAGTRRRNEDPAGARSGGAVRRPAAARSDASRRAGHLQHHRVGRQPLAPIAANRDALIGPPPGRNGGAIGAITPDAMTTIGGGLRVGRQQLTVEPEREHAGHPAADRRAAEHAADDRRRARPSSATRGCASSASAPKASSTARC